LDFFKFTNFNNYGDKTMSRHPSLKVSGKIRKKRNVLKRYERIDLLSKDGRWKEGDKVLGLPKTKSEV
jgi:small basic protein (TIGR04137 family)